MDIQISLPDQIRTYVEEQLTAGGYSTVSEYFLHLVRQDQRRRAQEKLETLILTQVRFFYKMVRYLVPYLRVK